MYVGGYGGLSESGLCVFCKSCPVCFLVVGKGLSESGLCVFCKSCPVCFLVVGKGPSVLL